MKLHPTLALSVLAAAGLAACGGGGSDATGTAAGAGTSSALAAKSGVHGSGKGNVAVQGVAGCRGPNDRPETALQGQVPAALRNAGFKGFNCNLSLVGQYQGEGGNWSSATFTDHAGRQCAYHS